VNYHFDKNFIPSHSLQEQLKALKEKLWQSEQQYADTVQPMDDDDLDEINQEKNNGKL
jgi:SRSO17 transposase